MNLLGLHAMVATAEIDAASVERAAQVAAGAGYDLLELTIMDPTALAVDAARRSAAHHGLQLACSLGLSHDTDVSSEDPQRVEAGVQILHRAVDVTADLGGERLCGVLSSALDRYTHPASEAGRANAIASIREVATHAGERGVDVCLEVVNRYESNLLTTTAAARTFIEEVGSDRVWIHLDSYHALIEEDSMSSAVRTAGDRLGYVHVGQNDRGALDTGTVDVDELMAALREAEYGGPITFEAFSRATGSSELANTLAIWGSPWTDGERLAREAAEFLRARM